MNMDLWLELVKAFGPTGAIFSVCIFAFVKGYVIPAGQVNRNLADADARLNDLREQHKQELAAAQTRLKDWTERFDEMRKEKDFWRDSALRNMEMAERTLATAQTAVSKLPLTQGGQ